MYTIHYSKLLDEPFLCGKVKVPGEDLRRSLPGHEIQTMDPGQGREPNWLMGLQYCQQCCLKLCLIQVDGIDL